MLKIIIAWLLLTGIISAIALHFKYVPWKPVIKFLIFSSIACIILAALVVLF